MALQLLLLIGLAAATSQSLVSSSDGRSPPTCRCRGGMACFRSVPFAELNRSIGGRLVSVPDEMEACLTAGTDSAGCQADLSQTDHEFFYTRQVGGYLHTGGAS